MLRRSEQTRFSSASDDEVGGSQRAMREQLPKAASVGNRAPAVLRRSEQTRFSSASDDEVGGSQRAMREQLQESAASEGSKRYQIGWISCGVRPLP